MCPLCELGTNPLLPQMKPRKIKFRVESMAKGAATFMLASQSFGECPFLVGASITTNGMRFYIEL